MLSIKGKNNELLLSNKDLTQSLLKLSEKNESLLNKQEIIVNTYIGYKSYYILYTYMMYNMVHHLYSNPYSITNWLLITGGYIIYRVRC